MSWGIRIRKNAGDPWQRGKQFRRDRSKKSGWVFWRDTWPTRAAAMLRLARYRAGGWSGHVFEIDAPAKKASYPTGSHYSPNFTRAELNCKCGCVTPDHVERELTLLASDLERLREELGGKPLGVVSGYRCARHNKAVGGASQSQHMTGKAADLLVPHGAQNRYRNAANRVPAFKRGGIGVYPHGGVHVDRRGWFARWNDWNR